MADQTGGAAADSTAAPLPHRRPRVREVSSRFMSPLTQSNSTPIPSDFPRSKSAHRRRPSNKTDENLIPDSINRMLDNSSAGAPSTVQSKEKRDCRDNKHSEARAISSRSDTPIPIGAERIVPSRYRQVSNTIHRSNSLSSSSNVCSAAVTSAARLLQEATSDSCNSPVSKQGSSSSCPNSPLCDQPSVPDAAGNSSKVIGDCMRSLNFSSFAKMGGGVSRPPQNPSTCMRSGFDSRKSGKLSNHHEDSHSLKMLSNYYLQWRFANAKAEASINAQKQEAERKIWSLGVEISDMRDRVKNKQNELAVLRRVQTFTAVVEAQMPYLDEWSTLEEDYSNSLSGTTNALLSSSVRIPVNGGVRADTLELKEALNSALKVVDWIGTHIQRFIVKAGKMDTLISELARMVGGEKARINECGDLLSKIYSSQVKECSLRGTLIQWHHYNHHQHHKTEPMS
ncbi:hypothetical protein ABFX02_13G140800 [Erythranthe guttata]